MSKQSNKMPFEFVLDLLYPLEVEIKPMFGCYSLYVDGRLILFLRERDKEPEQNGVWVAATEEGFESLAGDLDQAITRELVASKKKWILINPLDRDFEETIARVCELVVKGDSRIGRLK